jgi:6-pyruvoyltetrahydropterin/6-carboxytetrahydropterin synthase
MPRLTTLELFKEAQKFSAGHFTIFSADHRENLHGHNFTVYVALTGEVGEDGLMADYVGFKKEVEALCASWNETFFLPARSPHLRIERADEREVVARFADETLRFLPRDVTLLDAANATLEELARLFGERLVADGRRLEAARVHEVVVKVASGPGQWASWTWSRE